MIDNPYKRSGSVARDMKKVSADVAPQDYAFFKRKFPNGCTGITDKLISTLYKKLIDELRRIDDDPTIPFDICYYSDSPGFDLLDSVIGGIQFGQHVGQQSGPDDERGIGGARETVRTDAVVSAVEESGNTVRRSKSRRDKKEKK